MRRETDKKANGRPKKASRLAFGTGPGASAGPMALAVPLSARAAKQPARLSVRPCVCGVLVAGRGRPCEGNQGGAMAGSAVLCGKLPRTNFAARL